MNVRQIRRSFIEQHLEVAGLRMLEFGAFDYPTYSKAEQNIAYLDFFSKAELAALHGATKPERVQNSIDVDFVVKEREFARNLSERFDLLIANHVIEHVPDLIRWLQNAEKILHPGGGRIFLSVPDKNYTFDLLRPVSRIGDLILAFEEQLKSPSLRQVFEHLYYHRPIKADDVWGGSGKLVQLLSEARYPHARAAWTRAKAILARDSNVDVHCNVFTYTSFLQLFEELHQAGYTALKVLHCNEVRPSMNEFHALLA